MKKKQMYGFPRAGSLLKILRIMRLGIYLLLLTTLTVSANGFSQNARVTLSMEQCPMLDIIKELHKISDFEFLYKVDELKKYGKCDLNVVNARLNEVMDQLLEGTTLTWREEDGVILIKTSAQPRQSSQQKTVAIQGIVKDNIGTIPGVTILLKGTMTGTTTGPDGTFKLQVPEQQNITLVFSCIGMKTKEIAYKGEKMLNVTMEEDVKEMGEVVITGIFSKSKETYTGAVSVITEKELKSFGNRNVLTTLRNIDPSFNIMESNEWGSNPNRLPEIEVRGASSMPDIDQLQTDSKAELNTPLIIMDGFEITLQRMMDLNDNEIRTITLLKDASATAIYGSRGANGVIVIETHEPEAGKLKFSYTGSLNIEVPDLSDYHLLNARQKLDLEYKSGYYDNARAENDIILKRKYNQILSDIEKGVDTYWLSKPLRTGIGHRHNVKVEGGDQSFRYSATIQYNSIAGVMKGSFRNNFNGGINLSYKHEKLIFRNNLNIALNKSQESPYGTFDQYVKLNPYWTPEDEQGTTKKFLDDDYSFWSGNNPGNPLYNATLNTKNTSDYVNINNNFSIEWKPIDGFTLRGKFGIKTQTDNNDKFLPPEHTNFAAYTGENLFRKGSYQYGTGKNYRYDVALTASYSKVLAEKHMIYAGLNVEMEESKSHSYAFAMEGFPSGSLDFLGVAMQYLKNGKPSGSENSSRRMSMASNVNYSFHDRYFIDGSYSIDGSSLYGSDKRFAGFWSVGMGWNLHREQFMQDNNTLNRLKIRASVGETGSNNFSAYEAMATYKYILDDRYYQWMGAKMQALANPDLQWQKTRKYNAGVEINAWGNRVSVVADIYLQQTRGLMSSLELPPSNGFPSYKSNIGELENKGFELKTTVFILRNTEQKLIWSLTGSLVHNKNKIVKLSEAMREANDKLQQTGGSTPNQIWKEGDPMDAIYVVPSLGIDPSTGKELYLRKNGEVSYAWNAADRVFCGISQPKYRGNINTMFKFRDISMNLSFGYRWGGQQYNKTLIDRVENADKKYNVDDRVYQARWIKAGDRTFFKGINETTATKATSRFVQDEKTFTCQNINITYELRQNKWIQSNLGIESLTVKGDIADLFRISTIKQERGLLYPFSRQFSFSLTLMF